jgi:hypothetical protein
MSGATLSTWPELAAVAVTKEINPAPGAPLIVRPNGQGVGYGYLHPQAALADRWYQLKVASVPSGVTVRSLLAPRFRPGSDPVFVAMNACLQDGQYSVALYFSEGVSLVGNATDAATFTAGDQPAQCVLYNQNQAPVRSSFGWFCEDLEPGVSLRVRIGNAFQAESGKFVRDVHARELDYSVTLGPECSQYRVE